MTSSDILTYVRQIAPDCVQLDNAMFNFIDQSNRRLVKKVLWPDCWMTTLTVAGQQEYSSLPVLQVNAVYVGGQLATPTDRATLEGRQIGLYSQVAHTSHPFVSPRAEFTGQVTLGGSITPGDVLTTVLGGIPVAYVVAVTDADFQILVQSIVNAINATPTIQAIARAFPVIDNPTQISITQLNNAVAPLTLSVGTNVGATETFVASGPTLTGASNGSGGAPGTIGPFAPTWVIAQEPLTYPVQNAWTRSIRPSAEPWGYSTAQPPRYYWRGGKIAIVPNVANPGVVIAMDCVRSPDLVTVPNQIMTSPYEWLAAIAADVLRQAYMGDGDSKHVALAQMWESSYQAYEKEILLWRGTFEGESPGTYKMQTERVRLGLGSHRRGRRRGGGGW
jgi:hypothetical protein